MGVPEWEENTNIDMEMYMATDGLYMQDPLSNRWAKLPPDDFDTIIGQTTSQVDASSDKFNEYMLDQINVLELLSVSEEGQQLLQNTKL